MKQIIILEKMEGGRFKYALWAAVPSTRQSYYANPDVVSAFKGATTEELNALKAGQVAEMVDVVAIDGTLLQVEANLQQRWADFQAQITNTNPWLRYGSFWDGATWTPGGVS